MAVAGSSRLLQSCSERPSTPVSMHAVARGGGGGAGGGLISGAYETSWGRQRWGGAECLQIECLQIDLLSAGVVSLRHAMLHEEGRLLRSPQQCDLSYRRDS